METRILAGTVFITLAMIVFSAAVYKERKKRLITNLIARLLMAGTVFDVTATTLMSLGAKSSPFTLHGILGYTGMGAMVLITIFYWKTLSVNGTNQPVSQRFHTAMGYVYLLWMVTFITGAMIGISR